MGADQGPVNNTREPSGQSGQKTNSSSSNGSWFGEIALLRETARTASVRTITACDLFCLQKEDFQGEPAGDCLFTAGGGGGLSQSRPVLTQTLRSD
eukprot:gene4097-biopygen3874